MENADDSTVTGLATSLLDVGGNVLQAATRTVSKDKENDPAAVIEVCFFIRSSVFFKIYFSSRVLKRK
mgnify:CR=1 FL=1